MKYKNRNGKSEVTMDKFTLYTQRKIELKYVNVMFEFVRIYEIDMMNEKYTAEIHIESEWSQDDEIITYSIEKDWNPKLYIENSINITHDKVKYNIRKNNEKFTITENRYIKGSFWERLELHNFPLDIQELSITLASELDPNEVKLLIHPHKLSGLHLKAQSTFIDQQKWKLYNLVKVSNQASYDIESSNKTPKLVASCFCSRKPGYYLFNAFFLIFIITSVALCIFSINYKLPQNRLATSFTILLSSISFKWVVNRSIPTVSYLTSLDKYSITCIVFICSLSVWHAIAGSLLETNEFGSYLDKIFLIVYTCIFIIIHLGLLTWFIRAYSKIRELKQKETQYLKEILN